MRGPSHVVFGLAGAVVADGLLHLSGAPLIGASHPLSADAIAQKAIFYACAGIGALVPDIDNARSTLGRRLGFISRGIQHFAGHRTLFHSFFGILLAGTLLWAAQYALGVALLRAGLPQAAQTLGVGIARNGAFTPGIGVAFIALLVGYTLHLVADSLTEGGVPWLWPSRVRFGFPPERSWRFKSGSAAEPVVVITVSVLVIVSVWMRVLPI